jgi:hypothetical protein
MKAKSTLSRTVLLVSLISMSIWSCAGKSFDPPQADEIPSGQGIFTKGEDGVVLYDSNESVQSASPAQAPATSPVDTKQPAVASDYKEFEAYRQWLDWKKSTVGTPEYREFQQWREWREYQEWKKYK